MHAYPFYSDYSRLGENNNHKYWYWKWIYNFYFIFRSRSRTSMYILCKAQKSPISHWLAISIIFFLFFYLSSIVIFTFIASWLPFFIHYISKPFLSADSMYRNELLEAFLIWLGWLNSAMNPFIYAFYNNDFRIAFYRLTFRNCCKNQENNVFKWANSRYVIYVIAMEYSIPVTCAFHHVIFFTHKLAILKRQRWFISKQAGMHVNCLSIYGYIF